MANIKQVKEDLGIKAMRELLIYWGAGYPMDQVNTWSEGKLRATMQGDHKDGLLSDGDIREVAEGA